MFRQPIVILGSGLAGYTVARELRKLDREVALTVITADDGAFYSKPMLSNALAQRKEARQLATSDAAAMAAQLQAQIHAHTAVSAIDRKRKAAHTDRGEFAYGKLVLALGAAPVRLPLGGDAAQDVLSVNSLADYARFRERLSHARSIAVLGAGLIGCEFANDLVAAGYTVHVFDIADQPLGRLLPPGAAALLRAALAARGVTWHLGSGIAAAHRDGGAYRVETGDGVSTRADLLLSAVGLRPHTELAAAAGLAPGRAVKVDAMLRTDDDDIYALGDCAEVDGVWLPYVQPIMVAARALAPNLLGGRQPAAYPAMPVSVKTPACPVVVAPPPAGVPGTWREEPCADGVRALYVDAQDVLRGYALAGTSVTQRQALTARLGQRLDAASLTA